jgi:nitrite reductase/ring-hydroxylating ferredoxin subunit
MILRTLFALLIGPVSTAGSAGSEEETKPIDPQKREVFAVNNDIEDTMLVLPCEAKGNVRPLRLLSVPHQAWGLADPHGIAWDETHNEIAVANHGNFRSLAKNIIHAMVNKCAHRGARVCRSPYGNASHFTSIYHQWNYGLAGRLLESPFRKGVPNGDLRAGGMPDEFSLSGHGLHKLKVEALNGVVFVSFDHDMAPFREYLGDLMWYYFERVFDRAAAAFSSKHQPESRR